MDPAHDPRCLVTTEALFLDGANGVCGTPRHHAGEAPPTPAVLLFVAVACAALLAGLRLSPRRRARGQIVAMVVLVLGAIPGMWAVLAVRADRPGAVALSASRVARAHDEVHAFATAHGGARLRTETEMSVVPIARLALAGVSPTGTAPIDLFDDTLEDGCRDLGDVLSCGTPPAPLPGPRRDAP